jgi:hypothetical protein
MIENEDKEFFISTTDEIGDYLIYSSDIFKFSEIDLINLIKICLIEARSKAIGKKLLEVYRDSTKNRESLTKQRLNLIGVKDDGKREPIRKRKPKTK